MQFYKAGEFAQLLGITTVTLRNWEKRGWLLPHHKSSTGYRYYSEEQLNEYYNASKERVDTGGID